MTPYYPSACDVSYFGFRFILDNIAVNRIKDDYTRQNPKSGVVIPPYNAQNDRHPKAYFKFAGVDKVSSRLIQEVQHLAEPCKE